MSFADGPAEGSAAEFAVSVCSSTGAWWSAVMRVDYSAITVGAMTIPMDAVMFFARLDGDALMKDSSLMIEFEENAVRCSSSQETNDDSAAVLCGGCVEPGRLRIAPRPTTPSDGHLCSGGISVEAIWAACCRFASAGDLSAALETDDAPDGCSYDAQDDNSSGTIRNKRLRE